MNKEVLASRVLIFLGLGRLLSISFVQPIYVYVYCLYKKWFAKSDFAALEKFIVSGQSVIDIGANIGLYTRYFAKRLPDGHVLAIEPEQKNIKCLQNLKKKYSNVMLFEGAVGNNDGTANFSISHNHPGDHHLSDMGEKVVAIKKIDTLVKHQFNHQISLIKIDVQGAELEALKGAEYTIKTMKPTFFIEIDDKSLKRFQINHQDIFAFFERHHYEVFKSKKGRLIPYDQQQFPKSGFEDLFFIGSI